MRHLFFFVIALGLSAGAAHAAKKPVPKSPPPVKGIDAVTIRDGWAYVVPVEHFPVNATVNHVACTGKKGATASCEFAYGTQGGFVMTGTMIGAQELFTLASKCKAAVVDRITCGGPVDEFGRPIPEKFACTAFCN
jgi:hypothetical protein